MSWLAEADYLFVGAKNSTGGGSVVISTDPTLTLAKVTSPSANTIFRDVLMYLNQQPTAQNVDQGSPPLALPILQGESIYVVSSSASTVMVFLDSAVNLPD